MTRPNILRADTLDLQDHENPSAAEHAKHPQPTVGNAPHVAAQVHQVLEERHSEEQALADAWNGPGSVLEDPSAGDHADLGNGHGTNALNGISHDGDAGEHGSAQEGEVDDDMMDRISSSPSIDDGAYILTSSSAALDCDKPWPRRSCSLSPSSSLLTPTGESFNQTVTPTPESSPFWQSSPCLPRSAGKVRHQNSPLARHSDSSSSPYDEVSPQQLPLKPLLRESFPLFASKHHQPCKYDQDSDEDAHQDSITANTDGFRYRAEECFESDGDSDHENTGSDDLEDLRPIESPFRRHSFMRSLANLSQNSLEQSPSLSSIQSVDLDSILLPAYDPLLDPPSSPTDSAASWESMSETSSDCSGPGCESKRTDDAHDAFLDLDDRFIDSGWGGECLREIEDIDFEFVYALHTFVATVEGQANATKGDTMVLLDDSNSYWWLVRVVKDSSIGYLPAEHIETPTERLARLNKHRNIDLSATMLSDNAEKSRNPLKKAIRRRNAKTVQFAAPTYVEASDCDYSSEDEENMIEPYGTTSQPEQTTQEEPTADIEEPKIESKDATAEGRSSTSSQRASFDREQAATAAQALVAAGITSEDPTAPKLVDDSEAAPIKSKKRTNTDSFLKDDNIETRKITLTPGLLRDESMALNGRLADSPRSDSFDSLAKTTSPPDQPKKEAKEAKKKETKKPGIFNNLFRGKKKDKKSKEDANESTEKLSGELSRESPRASPLPSGKSSFEDKSSSSQQSGSVVKGSLRQVTSTEALHEPQESTPSFIAELEGSEVAHEMAAGPDEDINSPQARADAESGHNDKGKSSNPLSPITNPITNMLKTGDGHEKPKKAKRSKQRVELDDFDSPQEEVNQNPFSDPQEEEENESGRLSESPVEIPSHAFMHGTDTVHIPEYGQDDEDEEEEEEQEEQEEQEGQEEEEEDEGPGSLTSSPSIIEYPAEPPEGDGELVEDNDPTPTARSPQPTEDRSKTAVTPSRGLSMDSNTTSSSQRISPRPSPTMSSQTWSDESLRAWLEDGSEVRDMLVMIHDKTGVTPAPPDHPLMAGLFVEQRKGVQDMLGQLDGLLGSYLQRKGVRF